MPTPRTSSASVAVCLLLAACASNTRPQPQSAPRSAPSAHAVPAEPTPASLEEVCAGLRSDIVAADQRHWREQAQEEADETGEDVEETLRRQALERAEYLPSGPPRWQCPADNPGHYLPQPALPEVRLAGATASAVTVERMDSEGRTGRFLYLVLNDASGALTRVHIATSVDPGHGQRWEQLRVRRLAAEGEAIVIESEQLDCVPAGFDEETEGEPPSCHLLFRVRARCTRSGAEWSCEHTHEDGGDAWAE